MALGAVEVSPLEMAQAYDAFANGGTGTYRIVAPGNFADDFRDTYNDTNEALGAVSAGGNATNETFDAPSDGFADASSSTGSVMCATFTASAASSEAGT